MDLAALVKEIDFGQSERVIVGLDTADDAGVYRLLPDVNLIFTADFITPVTDDPYWFGRVAAANAISDVYAMGGQPKVALNLCGFPPKGVDPKDLTAILQGGLDAAKLAGCEIIGGHTVKDTEIKYGLSVVGVCKDKDITTNAGAQPGDKLILTKPIGSGLIIAGCKQKRVAPEQLEPVVHTMTQLNDRASQAMLEFDCSAATDVTGFGLAGHACEMAAASKAALRLTMANVPHFPAAIDAIEAGVKTAIKLAGESVPSVGVKYADTLSDTHRALALDPQTSGGLLIAINPDRAGQLLTRLNELGVTDAAIIGEVVESATPQVILQ